VLLALLLAADRGGLFAAERIAGNTLQKSENLASRPDVDIAGFPFLTQLATGNYDTVTITAHDVQIGSRPQLLEMSRIVVVLHKLTVSHSLSHFHAARADATGVITYDELGAALGVDVSYAGNGRIKAGKTVQLGRRSVTTAVTAQPRLVDGKLSFTNASLRNGAELGPAATNALTELLNADIPLSAIPFEVRVTSLHADVNGIEVALAGRNLSYSS
jgi:hypothetical protein